MVDFKIILSKYYDLFYAFRRTFAAFAAVLIVNWIVIAGSSVNSILFYILAASRSTPWGVFTSLFAHYGFQHFITNMTGLLFYSSLFVLCNTALTSENKRRVQSLFLFASFGSAVLSNVCWLFLTNIGTIGASGLVYAEAGVVTGFALVYSSAILNWKKYRRQNKGIQILVLPNLTILAISLLSIILYPRIFLSYAPGVNIFEHGFSFLAALVTTLVWNLFVGKVSFME